MNYDGAFGKEARRRLGYRGESIDWLSQKSKIDLHYLSDIIFRNLQPTPSEVDAIVIALEWYPPIEAYQMACLQSSGAINPHYQPIYLETRSKIGEWIKRKSNTLRISLNDLSKTTKISESRLREIITSDNVVVGFHEIKLIGHALGETDLYTFYETGLLGEIEDDS
jgi:hypothetical protein